MKNQKGTIVVDGIELTNDLMKIDEVRREVGMFTELDLLADPDEPRDCMACFCGV